MPGKASLLAKQYYAHPRNAFWRIMGELLEFEASAPYEERLQFLIRKRIALWDVLKSCTRESSLDSDIVDSSRIPNDFVTLLSEHLGISTVFFNGEKAESSFTKLVAPILPSNIKLNLYRLPSTSPANASVPYARKLEEWNSVVRAAENRTEP